MEQMKNNIHQELMLDEMDYIDIPAFIKRALQYARKYILLVVPLIICMSVCLAILSKPYAKKDYIAGGTALIGVRLSDSLSFDYTLSGLSWSRQSTLDNLNSVLTSLTESGYITQCVKDTMGINRREDLKGTIYLNAAHSTNLLDISVVSDSLEDAEAIRSAVFDCFPEAVSPAVGFIEMDIQEMYTREEASSKAYLTSPKVWIAGGVTLGIVGYLGLIFLYTLTKRDVNTPKDVNKLTNLPYIGRLPALKKRIRFHNRSNNKVELINNFVVTDEYQKAFKTFRRALSEEIQQHQIKVLLLTGSGHRRGQSTIAAELQKSWQIMGKKVILTNLDLEDGSMTEEKAHLILNQRLEEADIILIDAPPCDQSANALILADCADAMIMVIREGSSSPDEIKEMFQSLQYAKARPLGYVLNICSNM